MRPATRSSQSARSPRSLLVALATVGALAAACSGGDGRSTVLVAAASSLTDVLAEMETRFEAANPDVDVELSLTGSTGVRVQVEEGAPVDVVVFADADPMAALVDAGFVDDADVSVLATNRLVLATPTSNPGDVDSLDDLADPDLTIGVCAPSVPCGSLAVALLDDAGVEASLDTEEPDVRSLVAKLVAGELDAGLVYATDVAAFADDLRVVATPTDIGRENDYPIAALADSGCRTAADAFVQFALSADGRTILADAGFRAP